MCFDLHTRCVDGHVNSADSKTAGDDCSNMRFAMASTCEHPRVAMSGYQSVHATIEVSMHESMRLHESKDLRVLPVRTIAWPLYVYLCAYAGSMSCGHLKGFQSFLKSAQCLRIFL